MTVHLRDQQCFALLLAEKQFVSPMFRAVQWLARLTSPVCRHMHAADYLGLKLLFRDTHLHALGQQILGTLAYLITTRIRIHCEKLSNIESNLYCLFHIHFYAVH